MRQEYTGASGTQEARRYHKAESERDQRVAKKCHKATTEDGKKQRPSPGIASMRCLYDAGERRDAASLLRAGPRLLVATRNGAADVVEFPICVI